MGSAASHQKPRSERINGRPDRFATFVKYGREVKNGEDLPAQYQDVSLTGMRLISRLPAKAAVGDILSLQFTLPGTKAAVKQTARVVRKINDYDFSVRFVEGDGQLNEILEQHKRFLAAASITLPFIRLKNWLTENRQGLLVALAGALVLGGLGAYLFLNSDYHLGKSLKSWGDPLPKEAYWDYYNKIPKQNE